MPTHRSLELEVDVGGDEDVELSAAEQRSHSFVGRLGRDELLIATRRAVTDEDAADPCDLDGDRAGERLDLRESLRHYGARASTHPYRSRRVRRSSADSALPRTKIAFSRPSARANVSSGSGPHERSPLTTTRSGGSARISSKHRLERHGVAVDVADYRDARYRLRVDDGGGRRPVTLRISERDAGSSS